MHLLCVPTSRGACLFVHDLCILCYVRVTMYLVSGKCLSLLDDCHDIRRCKESYKKVCHTLPLELAEYISRYRDVFDEFLVACQDEKREA